MSRVISAGLFFLATFGLVGCGLLSGTSSEEDATEAYDGFTVEGRHLYDPCGERVVLRGVNHMTVWLDDNRDGMPAFREIAKTGANVVRIVWDTTATPEQLEVAVQNAVEQELIPMIELHNATGKWDLVDEMVDYWVRPATVEMIRRHEEHLLVNIANEAGDNSVTDEQFKNGYATALQRMRDAGIRTPIVIDAAGWGRNEDQILRTAPWLLEQDPRDNLLFSVHWWHSDNDKQRITDALSSAVEKEIPLVIGEFAHKEVGCKGQIAYEHLIKEAERFEIGWLAWSWGPGNSDCAEMDMTEDGTVDGLHGWGRDVALTDSFSIRKTAERPRFIQQGQCPTARR
jgi:mannan endo-1,4-beta-mannosidase